MKGPRPIFFSPSIIDPKHKSEEGEPSRFKSVLEFTRALTVRINGSTLLTTHSHHSLFFNELRSLRLISSLKLKPNPNPSMATAATMESSARTLISMRGEDHPTLKLYALMLLHSFDHILWPEIFACIPQLETIQEDGESEKKLQDQMMICGCPHLSLGNKLIQGDLRCGGIEDACVVFDGFPKRHSEVWNSMILMP